MCTASWIATPGGYRLVFTRDEQRQRTAALPPRLHQPSPATQAVWPIDGAAGGTWIACNQSGLSLALLNYNPERADHWRGGPGERSRGEVIPQLITATTATAAATAAQQIDCAPYRPFHLLMIDHTEVTSLVWDGRQQQQQHHHQTPGHLASSGLGDAVVSGPRAARFASLMADQPNSEQQDRFHADQHGADSETWVRMQRSDARSVSQTNITVSAGQVHLRYQAIDELGALATPHDHQLDGSVPAPGAEA